MKYNVDVGSTRDPPTVVPTYFDHRGWDRTLLFFFALFCFLKYHFSLHHTIAYFFLSLERMGSRDAKGYSVDAVLRPSPVRTRLGPPTANCDTTVLGSFLFTTPIFFWDSASCFAPQASFPLNKYTFFWGVVGSTPPPPVCSASHATMLNDVATDHVFC